MYPFWQSVIEPLLHVWRPRIMVEIGSEAGRNLANLIRFAVEHGAKVHAIDPQPLFDVDRWVQRSGGRLEVHRGTSLEVLPAVGPFDTLFVDGDHNWYTVYHELKTVAQIAAAGMPFPLILLHDIGWPWGRRDLYYDPATIPPEYRQPFSRARPAGRPGAGYHDAYFRAEHEGGPRNGVLTAVEDFVAGAAVPLDLVTVPGFAGLGILVERAARAARPGLDEYLQSLELSPRMRRYVEDLEAVRMRRRRAR